MNRRVLECFSLPDQPFRSANLEFDYGEKEFIEQYIPTAKSAVVLKAVCESLDIDSRDRAMGLIAPYGSGKTSLFLFLCSLLEKEQKTQRARSKILKQLEEIQPGLSSAIKELVKPPSKGYVVVRLSGNKGSLPNAFKEGLKESLCRKTRGKGANLNLIWNKSGGDKVESQAEIIDLYHRISKKLKSKKFEGIIILYDEFGKIFESHQTESRSDDLFFLQNFAEKCSRSGLSRIFLMVAMHQGFAQYTQRLPSHVRAEWVKIEGRFQMIPYVEDSLQVYDLIGQAIKRLHSEKIDEIQENIVKQSQELSEKSGVKSIFTGIKDKDILSKIFKKTYPLHPATLYALPRLSARVSQNERTLFHFLLGSNQECLFRLLQEKEENSSAIPLIKLHDLFPYFSELMASDNRSGGTNRRLMEIRAAIDRVDGEDLLAIQLIQSIGFMGVLSDHNKSPVTHDLLQFLFEPLSLKDKKRIQTTLDKLVKEKVLLFKKHSGEYRIWEGSDVDLNGIIRQKKAKISGMIDPATILNSRLRPPHIIPHKHNEENCLTRAFEGSFITARELEQALPELEDKKWVGNKDGQILYVLADSSDEIQGARKTCEEIKNPHLLVAVPMKPLNLVDLTDELYCLEELLEDAEFLSADPVIQRELEVLADDCFMEIKRKVEIFRSFKNKEQGELILKNKELSWWYRGEEEPIPNRVALGIYVSGICDNEFPDTPRFNHELINRRKPSPSIVNARRKILRFLLSQESREDLGLTGYGPDLTIFRAIYKNTSVFTKVDASTWKFNQVQEIPDKKIRDLYEMVHQYFCDSEKSPKTVEELVEKLNMPPYGIRRGLIPLIIAAAFKSFYLPLNMMENGLYIQEIQAEHFERMLLKPEEISVQCVSIPTRVKEYLEEMTKMFTTFGVVKNKSHDPVRACIENLYRWIYALAPYAMETNKVSQSVKELRLAIKKATDPVSLLFQGIPNALGIQSEISKNVTWLKDDQYKEVIEKLSKAKEEMEDASKDLLNQVSTIARDIFHLQAGSVDGLRKDFQEWVENRHIGLGSYLNDPQCSGLLERVSSKYDDDQKLSQSLASLVTGRAIEHWDDDFIRQYELNLLSIYNKLIKTEHLLDQKEGDVHMESRLKNVIEEPKFWEILDELDERTKDALAMFLISEPSRKKQYE